MTTFLITMTEGDGLLHLYPFEVEATDAEEAKRRADLHMAGWRSYILPGSIDGRVANRWMIAEIKPLDRPMLHTKRQRAGAPDVDNDTIVLLGDREIGRITMDRYIEGQADQTMRLTSDYMTREFVGSPGTCISDALAALRAAL